MKTKKVRKSKVDKNKLNEMRFRQDSIRHNLKLLEWELLTRWYPLRPYVTGQDGGYSFKRADLFVDKLLEYYEVRYAPDLWGSTEEEREELYELDMAQSLEDILEGDVGYFYKMQKYNEFAMELEYYKAYLHTAVRYLIARDDDEGAKEIEPDTPQADMYWSYAEISKIYAVNHSEATGNENSESYWDDAECCFMPFDKDFNLLKRIEYYKKEEIFVGELKAYYDKCRDLLNRTIPMQGLDVYTDVEEDKDSWLYHGFDDALKFMIDAFMYDHGLSAISDKEIFTRSLLVLERMRKNIDEQLRGGDV